MKISLNWIFDHIEGNLANVDVAQLVDTFIRTTAEIEGWRKITLNRDEFAIAEVTGVATDSVTVHVAEWVKDYTLPKRSDALVGGCFMVKIIDQKCHWVTSVMLGGIKDMMLPAVHCMQNLRAGDWKSKVEWSDYIIEVDNKSINSRPDLWGHRGLAREIAAILDVELKPIEGFVTQKASIEQSSKNTFSISIKASNGCDRFAALYLPTVTAQASDITIAMRLNRLDSRAIDFLVDATNYVMLDLGQPMHAFDADKFVTKEISVSYAQDKEKLALLDGETIELTSRDLVIVDGSNPVSLAGVMGGATTAISSTTQSVLLEAAHFDPVIVRRTSAHHKKRTESSMRFEKSLDPRQNVDAIKRFLFLLDQAKISYTADDSIISLGQEPEKIIIVVKHEFIEARLGVLVQPERIVHILQKIAFGVDQSVEDGAIVYTVSVPSFRATKDVKISEDIVEEIGRYIGYDTLPRVMPALPLRPVDLHATHVTRAVKRYLSYGLQMHELYGYSFFDEYTLSELAWQPTNAVDIKNPISENYTRMITTLQPNLIAAVRDNSIALQQLRFYEWARVWRMDEESIVEKKSLSGIMFNQKADLDFYAGKSLISGLFDQLHMNVMWQKAENIEFSWSSMHQTAQLMHEGKCIGTAGMVEQSVVAAISPAGGSAFIFEIDADALLAYRKPLIRFNPLSKYQAVHRDISLLISVSVMADTLINVIKNVDKRIESVSLIDFFSKAEWKDQKAMTFHVEICDKEKTLTSSEVDEIYNCMVVQLQEQGAVIR